jgi:hypothetical protein
MYRLYPLQLVFPFFFFYWDNECKSDETRKKKKKKRKKSKSNKVHATYDEPEETPFNVEVCKIPPASNEDDEHAQSHKTVCHFALFFLTVVFSVLRSTASGYTFGIFKLFLLK